MPHIDNEDVYIEKIEYTIDTLTSRVQSILWSRLVHKDGWRLYDEKYSRTQRSDTPERYVTRTHFFEDSIVAETFFYALKDLIDG